MKIYASNPSEYQPPDYIPKGGILKIGTRLTIDWDNPINHGISALTTEFWVSDVLHSEAENVDYYKVSWTARQVIETKDGLPVWGDKETTNETLYTTDEIFSWLAIIEPKQP